MPKCYKSDLEKNQHFSDMLRDFDKQLTYIVENNDSKSINPLKNDKNFRGEVKNIFDKD